MVNWMKRIKRDSGFTFVELMIVVAILAIGAGVCIFSLRLMLPEIRLKAAVRDLKSDLNSAKLTAVRNNALVSVAFDLANNRYTVFQDDGAGGGNVGNGVQDGTETLFKTVPTPPSVTLETAAFGIVGPYAQFNNRGLSNVGGGSVGMKNINNDYRGVTVNLVGKVQIRISTDNGVNWEDVDVPL